MGNTRDRRPRLHLDRHLRQAAGGHGLGEPGARAVGRRRRPRSASGSARASTARGARSSASSAMSATTASNKPAPTIVLLADPDARISPTTRSFVAAIARLHGRSSRTGSRGLRRRDRPRRLVGESEPAAAERPHAAGRVYDKSMARTSFTLVMLGDRRRDGAAARRHRHLRRHLVLGVAADARDRHPAGAGAQRAQVTRMFVRYGLGLAAIGIVCGVAVALTLARLMRSLLFEVEPDRSGHLRRCLRQPARRRGAGQLHAGAARDDGESGDGAQGRTAVSFYASADVQNGHRFARAGIAEAQKRAGRAVARPEPRPGAAPAG